MQPTVSRAAILSVFSTILVVTVKLVAAYLSGSVSVLAEALQSTVDVLMSGLALVTVRYAALPPDAEHPYGHGKAEFLSSALQMILILGSCGFIVWKAYGRLLEPEPVLWGWGAGAMAFAALANTAVAVHLDAVARRWGSPALTSEAIHLRGDTLSSLGVLVGMLLVGLTGWPALDPLAAIVFVVVTIAMAFRQLARVIHPLMDGSLPKKEVERLEAVLDEHPEVRGYHNLRTRMVGSQRFIELHVMLDDALTFVRAHDLAENIEEELRRALGGATVSIHYEPHEAEIAHREREHREEPHRER